jgi:hypothetical protein
VAAFHSIALMMVTALLGAGSPSAPAGDPVVLWLGPFDSGALDGAALLEAVSVYTRDLSLETRTATDVPLPTLAARDAGVDVAAGAAIRAHGARLGFWCEPAPDLKTTALIIVDGQGRLEVRVVDSAGLDGPELHRAIALKLRAVLAATIGPEVTATSGGAPRAPAPVADSVAVGGAGAAVVTTPRPVARGPGRFFGALGYTISTPFGSGSIQQGAAAEGGLRLGRAVELALGLAVETRASGNTGAGTVSLFDLPIDVEARWVRRRPHLSWGGGVFAAAHLLSARATAPLGAQQTSFDLGGGVGLAALVRGALGRGIAVEARLSAELPLPSTRYLVQGMPVLELGARIGLGLSLFFTSL